MFQGFDALVMNGPSCSYPLTFPLVTKPDKKAVNRFAGKYTNFLK